MGRRFAKLTGFLLGSLVSAQGVLGASPERGRGLYLNHCLACHESTTHVRSNRRARTLPEVRRWVARWSVQLELGWRRNEIDDVTAYLNRTYYRLGDISWAGWGLQIVELGLNLSKLEHLSFETRDHE